MVASLEGRLFNVNCNFVVELDIAPVHVVIVELARAPVRFVAVEHKFPVKMELSQAPLLSI